jgi:hypothetical protein
LSHWRTGRCRVTWTAYRKNLFDRLAQTQNADGSWSGGGGFSVGPVYSTAIFTIIMQLDKGSLPGLRTRAGGGFSVALYSVDEGKVVVLLVGRKVGTKLRSTAAGGPRFTK